MTCNIVSISIQISMDFIKIIAINLAKKYCAVYSLFIFLIHIHLHMLI